MTSKDNELYGLVLAGGKSTRMGRDKCIIDWHGKEQQYYLADLLEKFCSKVFISCREEQVKNVKAPYEAIADRIEGAGPATGILSAMDIYPGKAWLVVACDLPLMDEPTLRFLVSHRDKHKTATTFKSPHDGFPEPLVTIWEAAAKEVLLSYRKQGHNCPRKALINSDTLILDPLNEDALINANTPEEAARVRSIIAEKTQMM